MSNKHLYLNNRKNQQNRFNRQRSFGKLKADFIMANPPFNQKD